MYYFPELFPRLRVPSINQHATKLNPMSERFVIERIECGDHFFRLNKGILYRLSQSGAVRNRNRLYVVHADAGEGWLKTFTRDTSMKHQSESAYAGFIYEI